MAKISKLFSALIIASLFIISCSSDEDAGSARIQVALVDAPADYEAVYIDIDDVQVNVGNDEEDESGWQSLDDAQPGIYDLLKLTNGEEAFLGEIELPAGQLGQVRLILGDSNSLITEGSETELKVPSGSQSGLKLNVGENIEAGLTYKLVIDFDAAKSVVKAGNSGRYNLKPVLRASFEAQTGAIAGVVSPAEGIVYGIIGDDSISTYPDIETGEFLIRALEAGTYDVVAVPGSDTELDTVTVENVLVEIGIVTEVDTLKL